MRGYFADPVNNQGNTFTVGMVSLVKTAENQYSGMARMSVNGGVEKDVVITVQADDRTLMWSTEEGGLLPLFN